MDAKRIGILAGVVGVFELLVSVGPDFLLEQWGADPPGWAPTVGTAGQTVAVYANGTDALGSLLAIALAVGFGYYVGRGVDVVREYRRFVGAVAAGSAVGMALLLAGVYAVGGSGSIDAAGGVLIVSLLVRLLLVHVLPLTVGALAGASLAHFRSAERPPSPPTESDADASSGSNADASDRSDAPA